MLRPYSVLKKHGPIEARNDGFCHRPLRRYSVLKKHGPIEAYAALTARPCRIGYSVLKKHGPIEAHPHPDGLRRDARRIPC